MAKSISVKSFVFEVKGDLNLRFNFLVWLTDSCKEWVRKCLIYTKSEVRVELEHAV